MNYPDVEIAEFLSRPNRFIANVNTAHGHETVHVKNTGRCRELLIPGAEVAIAKAQNPNRKTGYDLIAVKKQNLGWVNIDSQICNDVVEEYFKLHTGNTYKREVRHGASRFDFLVNENIFAEVKGCTLEIDGQGYFPDAPTTRGCRHVQELTALAKEGNEAWLIFVIQMNGVDDCHANSKTDPEFACALKEAAKAGVRIFHALCKVDFDKIEIVRFIGKT